MKKGDIVKFKDGLYKEENGIQYFVIEMRGDRALIEFICELPLPPQSVALVSELVVIG